MSNSKKGHYRVDAVLCSGKHGTEVKPIETIASGLTYREAKQLQTALYDKHGFRGPLCFHVVRGAERKKGAKA